jgi:Calcineurin-like phosphoesterase
MNPLSETQLAEAHAAILRFGTLKGDTMPCTSESEGMWRYLQVSEQMFIQLMNGQKPPDSDLGNIEYGPVLYLANNHLPQSAIDFLRDFGMPPSAITPRDWQRWEPIVENGPGVVASDGSLISTTYYAVADLGWALALVFFLIHIEDQATFATAPNMITMSGQESLSLAIFGDWGTGPWQDGSYSAPATLVGTAIKNQGADISIHLGDVYYAGQGWEETDNLLPAFPRGSQYNFTLNSNHEMYDGAYSYFGTALANSLFGPQQKTSYFAITFGNWVIIGLDSAFYSSAENMYMNGVVTDSDQLGFIKGLRIQNYHKVLVLTHHPGITGDGSAVTPLFQQIYTALGNRYPDYWYYGHIHNGMVYNEQNAVTKNYKTPSGAAPRLRCSGHASIPFGNAYSFANNRNIRYYPKTPMPNPDTKQGKRVLNGYAVLTLTPNGIGGESFYEVAPDGTVPQAWSA